LPDSLCPPASIFYKTAPASTTGTRIIGDKEARAQSKNHALPFYLWARDGGLTTLRQIEFDIFNCIL
jgi:hypothetical protein